MNCFHWMSRVHANYDSMRTVIDRVQNSNQAHKNAGTRCRYLEE